MKILSILTLCVCLSLFSLPIYGMNKPDLSALADRVINRTATVLTAEGKNGLRMSEGPGQGLVWIPNVRFSSGTIELEVRGKDLFQKSFVGVAFMGMSDSKYELVYLRPFNFRAKDPVRRSHAVQYAFHPDLAWPKLRAEHPGKFENEVPSTLEPNEWVRLRVDVSFDRIRVFVGDSKAPSLDVSRLNDVKEGSVGLWVGEGSGGDFANLKIQNLQTTDPKAGELVLSAKDMPGEASLAFGEGNFDHQCLYATSTREGKIWKVQVGVRGVKLHR